MDSNFHTVHSRQPYTTSLFVHSLVEPLYAKVVHFCSFVTNPMKAISIYVISTMSSNPSFSAPWLSNSHSIHRPSCYQLTITQSSMSFWHLCTPSARLSSHPRSICTHLNRTKYAKTDSLSGQAGQICVTNRQSPIKIGW